MRPAASPPPGRRAALAARQQQLLTRSALLRHELGHQLRGVQRPLALGDALAARVRAAWRWLRAHPAVPAAALVGVAVLRPRRVWRWGLRLWWGWRSWRRLQRLLQAVR